MGPGSYDGYMPVCGGCPRSAKTSVISIVEQGQRLPCYSLGVTCGTTYLRLGGSNLDFLGIFGLREATKQKGNLESQK